MGTWMSLGEFQFPATKAKRSRTHRKRSDIATLPPLMKQEILDRLAAWRGGPPADDISLVIANIS
jgi:hypothetical protein